MAGLVEGQGNGSMRLNGVADQNSCFLASLKISGESPDGSAHSSESIEHQSLDVLAEGCDFLKELHCFLLQTAEFYRAGNEIKGREHFMELINGMECFVNLASSLELQQKIDFAVIRCAGRTLAESVDNLNGVLLDIIAAQEQSDLILLTDLLEYELAPQLELWLEIFTMLRRTRDADYRAEYLPS
jgi:hypothetical protein